MNQPVETIQQRIRFEEVSPANKDAAFLDASIESLVAPLGLPIYDGYDGLDDLQLTFLTLPSGSTVTLASYLNSPQPGTSIHLDSAIQNIPQVIFESCQRLQVSREEAIWFHPDWQDEIDRLYAEHGSTAKRPESLQVEELAQHKQYESIDCFNHALRIYTREYVPATYWAMLQHNLGLAYFNRNQGDRKENLERSIKCFNQSLEIFTQDEFIEKWEISQNDLVESQRSLELYKENLIEDILDRPISSRKSRQLKGVSLSIVMKGIIKIPDHELRILEAFAEKADRNKTDIIREYIRSLQLDDEHLQEISVDKRFR
jgi:Tetratricopeptide repeat